MRNLVISQRPEVLFLSELKCDNPVKIGALVKFLGFSELEFVLAVGRAGGLLLCWKSTLQLQVILATNNMINFLLIQHHSVAPWHFTAVYAPQSLSGRAKFWEALLEVGEAFTGP